MTTGDLRPGDYIAIDDTTRIVRQIVSHPAGAVAQWVGGDATPLARIAQEGRVIPKPLREPLTTVPLTD